MRKHNIHSPSDLETVLQLAKQCWKEGRDFPEERLPIPRAGDSKGRPRTRKITDYQVGGGFRPHARGTMAYSQVRRAVSLWITMDYLPYATVDTPAFWAMLRTLDPQAPDLGRKSVTSEVCIRICFLLCFRLLLFHLIFLWLMLRVLLYKSHGCITQGWSGWRTRRIGHACGQHSPATCGSQQRTRKHFTCMAHWVRDKVGGGLELKWRVVTTCEVLAETISVAGEWWTASYMFCYTFVVWKSSVTPRARSEAVKMELLKLTSHEVEAVPSTCFELTEQLHNLFFSCSPIGSPSWCLFLRYDIAAHPYATTTVLRLDAAVAPYYKKVVFWVHAASQGNNCITCSFRAVLLGRLHGASFCAMALLRTLTPLWQCYVSTLQLPRTVEKRYFGRTLQAKGTTAFLVPSMQSYWVAFMVLVFALWHCCAPLHHHDSAMFERYKSPVLWKSAILGAHLKLYEQVKCLCIPLPCGANFMTFLIVLWHHFYWNLCTMQYEQSWRRSARRS